MFKALAKNDNASAIADHVKTTSGYDIKWDDFDILAYEIRETCLIQELERGLNAKVGSEKLILY